MAQSTSNPIEKNRSSYPNIISVNQHHGESTASSQKKDTDKPSGEWNSGNESVTVDLNAVISFTTQAAVLKDGDSASLSDSDISDVNVMQSAINGANKMDATLAVHAQNKNQGRSMLETMRHQAKFSSCLTFGGAAMQVICLGFLINDFVNNPAALAANPGKQALYGLGLTSGVFSLTVGACCFINDLK